MTQPRISYNVHADAPNFNRDYFYQQLDGYNPTWLLIMNATRLAIETARRYPQTQVIARSYSPADDKPLESWGTWQNFLNHVKSDLNAAITSIGGDDLTIPPNLWIYTNNESGDNDKLHTYLTGLISQPELKFVVGNYSVGTPENIGRWNDLIDFLRLVSNNRQRVVLGLHEYFGVVPTSGFVGGSPVDTQHHPDYTIRANWPMPANVTTWHCGRFRFIVEVCKAHNVKPPRMILTEHGADNLNDIGAWAQSLPKTPPYDTNRGWRTLIAAWRNLYGGELDVERFFADSLIYLDKAVYADSVIEGQLIFSLFSSEQWRQFDIAYTGIPQMLRDYAGTVPTPPPPVEPPPIPTPDTKAQLLAMVSDAMDNLTAAKEQLASAVDTLNRLEETIENEL